MAGFMDFLGQAGGALGKMFTGGANLLGQGAGAIGGGLGSLANSFTQGFGNRSGGSGQGGMPSGYSMTQGPQMPLTGGSNMYPQSVGGGGGNAVSGLGSMFGNPMMKGLGTIFGSQLIGNPGKPQLPPSFNAFQQQANAGGPQISQQSNQYLSTLMSGQNTAANDAATHSLDLNYQEQLRQLQGMYKSLRPGTDPTSDTTYQRDLSNLNDQYTRQRAQVLAQQQMGAAQQGQQAGAEQASQQAMGVETQVNQIAQQWNMDAQQRAALRNMLMEVGGMQATGGMMGLNNLFKGFMGGGANG